MCTADGRKNKEAAVALYTNNQKLSSKSQTEWRSKAFVVTERKTSNIVSANLVSKLVEDISSLRAINPLAYKDVPETAGLARSINTQPAVRRNSETNPTSQHNRGMY